MAEEIELTAEDEKALDVAWALESWREPFGPDPTPTEKKAVTERLPGPRKTPRQ